MNLDKRIRNLGIVLVCYTLLSRCCEQLGSETNLFQRKSKQMLNNLLSTIKEALVGHSSLKNLYETKKETGLDIDKDEINDELNTHAMLIEKVHDILVNKSQIQIYDLLTYLNEYDSTGKLFTAKDLEEIKKTYDMRFSKLEQDTLERLKIIEEKSKKGEVVWKKDPTGNQEVIELA